MKVIRNIFAKKTTQDLEQAASEKSVASDMSMCVLLQRWLISLIDDEIIIVARYVSTMLPAQLFSQQKITITRRKNTMKNHNSFSFYC